MDETKCLEQENQGKVGEREYSVTLASGGEVEVFNNDSEFFKGSIDEMSDKQAEALLKTLNAVCESIEKRLGLCVVTKVRDI